MYSRIAGTGSYLPEKVLTNRDLERMVDTSDEWIVTRTGIRERRIAADGETASDMALAASRRALAMCWTISRPTRSPPSGSSRPHCGPASG